ncbi:MAG: acyltransferase family protein [Candidatus Acidiferrales bacterium]
MSGQTQAAEENAEARTGSATREMPAAIAASRRVPELDGLRGVAILQVVLLHFIADSKTGGFGTLLYRFSQMFRLGWSGVDLFFVLSGFLIGGILLGARESPRYFKTFYTRRVHRILPIYYLSLTLFAIVVLAFGRNLPPPLPVGKEILGRLPFYFLFLQNLFPSTPVPIVGYWLSVTWSLAVEEQFYLAVPLLIRFLSARRLVQVLIATLAVGPLLRWITFVAPGHVFDKAYYVLMPCRADALGLGVLAAIIWRSAEGRRWLQEHKKLLYGAMSFLACGMPIFLKWFQKESIILVTIEYSWIALFYAVVLLVILSNTNGILARAMRWGWLRELGTLSYTIYLIHLVILILCSLWLLGTLPRITDWKGCATIAVAAIITYGLAWLSWTYFEKPLVERGHRYKY